MKGSRRCTGVVTALGLVAACALLGLPPGRSVEAQEDPASRAIAYLQTQQGADGSIAGPSGSYADSELFAITAAAAGYDPTALSAASGVSVMSYLAGNVAGACPAPSADPESSAGAGDCGELIQAVVAAGEDPTAFGGVDLVSRLGGYYDPATGGYGDGEAFPQALAVQGLVAAGAPVPAVAVQFLVSAQDSDGGWDYRDRHPNGAADYDLSDTNSTSMVLMALDAAGDHGRDPSGLAWLAAQQDGDGGFPYQAGAGSDPDSTALVVQAIVATGDDPRWRRDGWRWRGRRRSATWRRPRTRTGATPTRATPAPTPSPPPRCPPRCCSSRSRSAPPSARVTRLPGRTNRSSPACSTCRRSRRRTGRSRAPRAAMRTASCSRSRRRRPGTTPRR